MVGWDFSEATVRVLTDGLPTPPSSPEPGVTFPVALHRGERLGAVLSSGSGETANGTATQRSQNARTTVGSSHPRAAAEDGRAPTTDRLRVGRAGLSS